MSQEVEHVVILVAEAAMFVGSEIHGSSIHIGYRDHVTTDVSKAKRFRNRDVAVEYVAGSSAEFSDCGRFRYTLRRRWEAVGEEIAFIGLNPSTADAEKNDPTVTRCIGYAKRWGFAGMWMLNLFSWRSTDPQQLYERHKARLEIIGKGNDQAIARVCASAKRIVCAWGSHGALQDRGEILLRTVLRQHELHCLGITKDGHPRHPLYLRSDARPIRYPAD